MILKNSFSERGHLNHGLEKKTKTKGKWKTSWETRRWRVPIIVTNAL
jgi:hypothetical protein